MDFNSVMLYTVFGLFGFLCLALILRWILGINGIADRQQIQIRLLIELCREKGIDEDRIEGIILSPWTYTKKYTK